MPSIQNHPSIRLSQTEDNEAIGTVRQFSDRIDLPASQVVPCLQQKDDGLVILRAGDRGTNQLLILGPGGMGALRDCVGTSPSK